MSLFATDEDRKKFMGAVKEISNSLIRMEAERDLIREIVKEKADEFNISKKVINKIAKTYHKQNRAQVEAEHEEFMELYDDATKVKSA